MPASERASERARHRGRDAALQRAEIMRGVDDGVCSLIFARFLTAALFDPLSVSRTDGRSDPVISVGRKTERSMYR